MRVPYATPRIRELGTVPQVTADPLDGGLHYAAVPLISGGSPTPTPWATPTGEASPSPTATEWPSATPTPTPDATPTADATPEQEVADRHESGGGDHDGGPTTGDGRTGGGEDAGGDTATGTIPSGGGESLPFTGFAANAVAALGGALTSAGVALRRAIRKH